jgi:hypothetical protein
MMKAREKLAFLAAAVLAAVMLMLGTAGGAEAHGLYQHPVKSSTPTLAAAPGKTSAPRAAFDLEADGRSPLRYDMTLQDTDRQSPASDRFDHAPCCGGGACHAGVVAAGPTAWRPLRTSAELPPPSCCGSPTRFPSGIERPPKRPSAI